LQRVPGVSTISGLIVPIGHGLVYFWDAAAAGSALTGGRL
jgi:hypothetical protein